MILTSCGCGGRKSNALQQAGQEQLAGGFTQWRDLSDEDRAIFDRAREAYLAEKEVCGPEGCHIPAELEPFAAAVPVKVQTQVVAGTNFRFDCGKILVKVFRPLPGRGDPSVTEISEK